ncbi:uncharacterized protein LOC131249519 [Magnolia sinica]|uniref:uncharacterized protein LOC131249519 n=1 Tax=Magnolia sinica TaxID=86752 RepID=UPI00265892FA|nr:uncharacterized protein LOC131249519 [Magnolia sinica]
MPLLQFLSNFQVHAYHPSHSAGVSKLFTKQHSRMGIPSKLSQRDSLSWICKEASCVRFSHWREALRGPYHPFHNLPLSLSPHCQTMLPSTFDMIHQASSNSLLIFCLCNFIIAILLINGSKSVSPSNGRESSTCVSVVTPLSNKRIEVYEKGEEDSDDQENCDEDNDDDELRKRVEEFIDKINRTWKAEKIQEKTTSKTGRCDWTIARLAINSHSILLISGSKFDSPSDGREGSTCAPVVTRSSDERIVVDEKGEEDENDQENCDDDDELRKRVEEFIDKINRRWKAEKMQGLLPGRPATISSLQD